MTTIAVTGASGFVGRHVIRELLSRGYQVRALVRDEEKARATLPNNRNLNLIVGDVLDRVSPGKLVEGAQACIHLIGIIREVRSPGGIAQTFRGMHVEATRAMLDACRDGGVNRFVQMSALGVSPDSPAEYATTKYEAEQLVKRSGLDWTIFRPTFIHGPDSELIGQIRKMATGDVAPWFVLPYFARMTDHEEGVILPRISLDAATVQPVHIDDVVAAFAESLSRPQSIGEIYNIVGGEKLDWRQTMEFLRDTLPNGDRSLTVIPVPATHASMIAKVAGIFGMGSLLPFDEGQPHMMARDGDAELNKLKAHFGINPRPFRSSVKSYAEQIPALV